MFLIRLIRWFLSLPVLWLGQLAAMFTASASLLKIAWVVGGSGRVARMALIQMFKGLGPELTLAQAEIWLAKRPTPEVAAWAGVLAADLDRLDRARELLALAHDCGDDPEGMIETLESNLALKADDVDAPLELARRWQARRDLAPTASLFVHRQLLWNDVCEGRHGPASKRADHLLAVADDAVAATIMWALCRREGRDAEAARHLRHVGSVAPAEVLMRQCMVSFAVGSDGEGEALLSELESMDAAAADQLRQVIARRAGR